MLSLKEAKEVIFKKLPRAKIMNEAQLSDLYLFVVYLDDVDGELDPYYSVNKNTGEFKEFSILTDSTPMEILELFSDKDERGDD